MSAYHNREVINGFSLIREVGPQDEWCAEAYLDTNYTSITKDTLLVFVKRYVLKNLMLLHDIRTGATDERQK